MEDFHEDLQTTEEALRDGEELADIYEELLGDWLVGGKGIEKVIDHVEREEQIVNQLEPMVAEINRWEAEQGEKTNSNLYNFSQEQTAKMGSAVELLNELEHLCRDTGDALPKHIRRLEQFKEHINELEDRESTFAKNIKSGVAAKQSTAGNTRR